MKCNYCQKDIEKGKEVKVNRGLLTTPIESEERSFFLLFYITKNVDKLFAKKENKKESIFES